MNTQCNADHLHFPVLGSRQVLADFDGGDISSDAGVLLLRKTEECTGVIRQFAACFDDHRDPDRVENPVEQLLAQRVYALALGYEDLNDHDDLRYDPLLATVVGKLDPSGESRSQARDRGKAMAGKSTLNRLELSPVGAGKHSRYKKIACRTHDVERLFTTLFLQAHDTPPARIVLDLDATDDPIHGHQLGRFFHGYYKGYCYLPLYIFCDDHLLLARLRPSNIAAAAGSVKHLKAIVSHIRQAWPEVEILIRGDSGFCREEIMSWCESNGVDYLLGLAKNNRLVAMIEAESTQARQQFEGTGEASRVFAELRYRTLETWGRERRVVAKAEHLSKGANPRFVVTSLREQDRAANVLYEEDYCGRGEIGEPDQGAAVAPVRRPHRRRDDACQPGPAVLLVDRLCFAECPASTRADRDGIGRGAVRDDPDETPEDRRVGPRDGAQGLGEDVERLPVCGGVPEGPLATVVPVATAAEVLTWILLQNSVGPLAPGTRAMDRGACRTSRDAQKRIRTGVNGVRNHRRAPPIRCERTRRGSLNQVESTNGCFKPRREKSGLELIAMLEALGFDATISSFRPPQLPAVMTYPAEAETIRDAASALDEGLIPDGFSALLRGYVDSRGRSARTVGTLHLNANNPLIKGLLDPRVTLDRKEAAVSVIAHFARLFCGRMLEAREATADIDAWQRSLQRLVLP